MRVADNKNLKGKELFDYLKKNKAEIIKTKKSLAVKSEPFAVDAGLEFFEKKTVTKASGENTDPNTLIAKVVGNTTMFCDSHLDVLGAGCYTKTIKENGVRGKNIIAHIHDHQHTIEAKLGIVKDIRTEQVSLKDLGVKGIGTVEALIFETEIRKDFNSKLFNLYKANEVNQHSIGLQYVKLELAVNDEGEEFKEEFALYKKHINQVINKEFVEERGYFWFVSEIKLFENSAVLFGANELTPTLEITKEIEPLDNTQENKNEPPEGTQAVKNWSYSKFI
tara:strand:- start:5898 stop:6734 length:837 start_codon:yes stop_codon:yes gene_type:complete